MDEKQGLHEYQVPSGDAVPPPYTESTKLPPAQAYPPPQQPYTTAYPPHTVFSPQVQRPPKPPEDYYTFSLLLSVLWCVTFAPYLLLCSIPALMKSKESRRAADSGDYSTAMEKGKQALRLNIVSIIVGFVLLMIFTVVLPILASIIVPVAIALTAGKKD